MKRYIEPIVRKKLSTEFVELEYDEIEIQGHVFRYVPTSRHSRKRIKTLVSKEPLTLPWIDTFARGDVYVDVGANVGMYTIYAGVRGARVFAFEPESQNYGELNKNIFVNGLHDTVTAYCVAVSDAADVSILYLSTFSIGFAHHDFGENRWRSDLSAGAHTLSRDQRPKQGCVSFPLDDLCARGVIKPPNHLKIDVDGFESKVIKGAERTLQSSDLKTILLEVDFRIPENVALIDQLTQMGWHFSKDQVRLNQHEVVSYQEIEDRMRRRVGGANFIFFKDCSFYDGFFSRFLETFVPPNPIVKAPALVEVECDEVALDQPAERSSQAAR